MMEYQIKAVIGLNLCLMQHSKFKLCFPQVVEQDAAPVLAVSGVFFVCPFCSSSYGRRDIRNHMEECLKKVQY